jgi:hypothetical protein
MVGCNSHAAWHRAPGKRSTKTPSTPSAGILLSAETMIIAARAIHGQTARRGAVVVLYAFAIIPGIIGLAAGNFSAAGLLHDGFSVLRLENRFSFAFVRLRIFSIRDVAVGNLR